MRTQRDATEPYQGDQAYRTENGQQPPMARFEAGQNKKQKLPVQKSSSNSVTAGKTVTRPIHKRAIKKRPLPVNKNLYPLVQKHPAGNSDNERHERWPPSFPCKEQNQREHNNTDPLPGTKVGERVQHGNDCRREALMEPYRKLLIFARKWIG